ANHVQTRTGGEFNCSRIGSQSIQVRFQRLIHITKRLDVRLHRGKLLSCNLNFGACSHVYRHTDSESRQQNHSENYPGWNYSAASPHVCARAEDLDRDLLYRGKGTRAWGHTLCPDSFVNPICISYLAHLTPPSSFAVQILLSSYFFSSCQVAK